ncbi:hypothetical protein Patl1_17484 [Pistacia atlantica]|uniref:Uncharacterized protein n=1 Tax=Pistacia atlantica TaxID=434234 RepID=A0ACC1BY42_9ROSI|nr:hypothetical protein Patl1_17484 [Pistacia atlantica]
MGICMLGTNSTIYQIQSLRKTIRKLDNCLTSPPINEYLFEKMAVSSSAVVEKPTQSLSFSSACKKEENMASASSVSGPQKSSTYDEFFMQQSLHFADTLKDLKNLRKQLYSAAEFFEISYSKEAQKRKLVAGVKDYAIKALINTVDHLGSVAFKVNNLFDERIDEASETGFRLTCLEQQNEGNISVNLTGDADEEKTDDLGLGQNPSSCENSSVSAEEDSTQLKIGN